MIQRRDDKTKSKRSKDVLFSTNDTITLHQKIEKAKVGVGIQLTQSKPNKFGPDVAGLDLKRNKLNRYGLQFSAHLSNKPNQVSSFEPYSPRSLTIYLYVYRCRHSCKEIKLTWVIGYKRRSMMAICIYFLFLTFFPIFKTFETLDALKLHQSEN